jgi:hypothetical protein
MDNKRTQETNEMNRTSTEIKQYPQVTTIDNIGGYGIGYLIEGEVWVTTGSYWACEAKKDVFGLASYIEDNGEAYLAKIKGIFGKTLRER